MCGRCKGEPYHGVKALFNGDLQAKGDFEDRENWLVVSNNVIIFLGEEALKAEGPLLRVCENGFKMISAEERVELEGLRRKLGRPAVGAA